VSSVAFSPDGRHALSGSDDKTLRLWEVASGKELRRFKGHTGEVRSVAFSPDGRHALSGSNDNTLRLWEVASGKELRRFKGHTKGVTEIVFSPDGRTALSGSADGPLSMWNVERGELLAQFASFRDGEWVAITPDGHYNASANGHSHVNFSQGDRVEGMDTAPERSRYFQPERVAARLGGTAFAALPPILTITRLAFSSGVLNAEESATLSLTLKNTGPGPARDVEVLLEAEGARQGLAFAPSTLVSEVAAGGEVTVQIPVQALESVPDQTQVRLLARVVEPHFKVRIEAKPFSFATRKLLTPELVLARFTVKESESGSAQPNNRIDLNEIVDVQFVVQNVGVGVADDVQIRVESTQRGVMWLGQLSERKLSQQHPRIARIEPGKHVLLTYRYFINSDFEAKEIQFTLSAEASRGRGNLKAAKSVAVDRELAAQGEVRVATAPVRSQSTLVIDEVPELEVDVRQNIPAGMDNRDAIAVVIGNRDYQRLPGVDYALNDARVMRNYLQKTFGFREGNIFFEANASKATLEGLFGNRERHKGRLFNAVKPGKSDVFVFYSGHGAPGLNEGEGYFVPVDADPRNLDLQGYPIETLYNNLKKLPARSVTVVLDTCFSGQVQTADNKVQLLHQGISPALIKSKKVDLSGAPIPTLLFASAEAHQVSAWYSEKQHSLFTYFFLKALHNRNADANQDGKLTAGELFSYVNDNSEGLPYYARRLHQLEQSPGFSGDADRILVRYQ